MLDQRGAHLRLLWVQRAKAHQLRGVRYAKRHLAGDSLDLESKNEICCCTNIKVKDPDIRRKVGGRPKDLRHRGIQYQA